MMIRATRVYNVVPLNNWTSHFGTITHNVALYNAKAVRVSINIDITSQTQGSCLSTEDWGALVAVKREFPCSSGWPSYLPHVCIPSVEIQERGQVH